MTTLDPQTTPRGEPPRFPHRLVPIGNIEGATAYNGSGDRLGTISRLMVDNSTGQIEYAVLALGGFLGMGESQHPVPWELLEHDTQRGGYIFYLEKGMLRGGPSYRASDEPDWDQAYADRLANYYARPSGVPLS